MRRATSLAKIVNGDSHVEKNKTPGREAGRCAIRGAAFANSAGVASRFPG